MALGNSNIFIVSVSQVITAVTASTQSATMRADTVAVTIRPVADIWVQFGPDPTAVASAGANFSIRAGVTRTFKVTGGEKFAVIRDSADGAVDIYEHPAP
jgi:predicted amino acid dehydrogenase